MPLVPSRRRIRVTTQRVSLIWGLFRSCLSPCHSWTEKGTRACTVVPHFFVTAISGTRRCESSRKAVLQPISLVTEQQLRSPWGSVPRARELFYLRFLTSYTNSRVRNLLLTFHCDQQWPKTWQEWNVPEEHFQQNNLDRLTISTHRRNNDQTTSSLSSFIKVFDLLRYCYSYLSIWNYNARKFQRVSVQYFTIQCCWSQFIYEFTRAHIHKQWILKKIKRHHTKGAGDTNRTELRL